MLKVSWTSRIIKFWIELGRGRWRKFTWICGTHTEQNTWTVYVAVCKHSRHFLFYWNTAKIKQFESSCSWTSCQHKNDNQCFWKYKVYADIRGDSSCWRCQMTVGLSKTAILVDLGGYFFGNFRHKASSIIWQYATLCQPVTDCKWMT